MRLHRTLRCSLLALAASLDHGAPTAVAALGTGLATDPVLAGAWRQPSAALARAAGALLGATLVACGIALVFDGIFDI